jgi:hypothetical protein
MAGVVKVFDALEEVGFEPQSPFDFTQPRASILGIQLFVGRIGSPAHVQVTQIPQGSAIFLAHAASEVRIT